MASSRQRSQPNRQSNILDPLSLSAPISDNDNNNDHTSSRLHNSTLESHFYTAPTGPMNNVNTRSSVPDIASVSYEGYRRNTSHTSQESLIHDNDGYRDDTSIGMSRMPVRRLNRRNIVFGLVLLASLPFLYLFLFWVPRRESSLYVLTPTVKVADYPNELMPKAVDERLIFIGDIHGCNVEFGQLLQAVDFKPSRDRLILVGDFISKGPNSIAVLEMAMKYNATCVRGNHENTLLRRYAKKHGQKFDNDVRDRLEDGSKSGDLEHFDDDDEVDDGDITNYSLANQADRKQNTLSSSSQQIPMNIHSRKVDSSAPANKYDIDDDDDCMLHELTDELESGDYDPSSGGFVHVFADEKKIIKKATPEQIKYMDSCPLILRLPEKIFGDDNGEVSVCHAGLMWNEPTLEHQDPAVLLYIRSVLPPDNSTASPSRDGILWKDVWNDYQQTLPPAERRTVVYGHDAKSGLMLERFSKGLDSRCYKGDYLTALVAKRDGYGGWEHDIVSVKCQIHDPKLPGYVDGRF